ncbi:alpha-mannosidase [Oculatella sp. LEGE 06141]|uniref:alpha-mannosidase n=1 Tax=Oculatella sp. LEGE 06141 TaxID=1828648 RepID=UPI0018826EC7|nr:alpha-mannosidase [Oculatella sp. LEGE 06141]MBE9179767.1 alpha-mannosidase [Oculatella sp. LEGE 06141]
MTDSVTPPPSQSRTLIPSLSGSIERLRQLSQLDVQSGWRYCLYDVPIADATQSATWQSWPTVRLNARQHVAWDRGHRVIWLGQQLVVPSHLNGYALEGLTLRLSLTWWADAAEIFVNGVSVQAGDLFDCSTRLLLSAAVKPGEAIAIAIRLVSPGHDDGALVHSLCLYERPDHSLEPVPEPGFVADELAVLHTYLTALQPEQVATLEQAIAHINWSALPQREIFDRSLLNLRQQLQPFADWIKQRQIQLLGHAHLDLAWLWEIRETWEAAERTFQSVLQLLRQFPELMFCHSTPALYDWIEQHRPALFTEIQRQIADGRWEVVAGLWVEPEFNTVSGESIARQVLYGQRYAEAKFGTVSPIAWLPDSFGFCWQLPQILEQGEVDYFVTQKLRWNDSTSFPHELFWWRSPDGTQRFSLMSAPIGTGIDPVKMVAYACDLEVKTGVSAALWLPGVGDHGGGPTRDMVDLARRWQRSPFFPTLAFTTASAYLQTLERQEQLPLLDQASTSLNGDSPPSFPVWNDELYLEFHRGCYTTHAGQKRSNRQCEILLYQAELFASISTLLTNATYPGDAIEAAWKKVLFNQFHDILPGSAIAEVYTDANQAWQDVKQVTGKIVDEALTAIAAQIDLPSPPQPRAEAIVVFNSLNWKRSQVVTLPLAVAQGRESSWQVFTADGEAVETQRWVDTQNVEQVSFWAIDVPAVGYRVFWLCATPSPAAVIEPVVEPVATLELENDYLHVRIDPATGDIAQMVDKVRQRSVLNGAGNQLQAFQDKGQYWDAWNIDPNYADHPLPSATLQAICYQTHGSLETRLGVTRQLGTSTFRQTYVLRKGSPILEIESQVDWQEQHVMVKAAFPLNLTAAEATYEIPFGAIARSTQSATPQEAAKWEVPALQWADLSQADYGVSLLNNCKYGYDSQPAQLRLTLLRSPNWPHPGADRGHHEFTYALYPHGDTWQMAQTVRRGYELNQPLRVVRNLPTTPSSRSLPPVGQFIDVSSPNLILSAFKPAEANPNQWILRCYECHGEPAEFSVQNSLGLTIANPTNLLERSSNAFSDATISQTQVSQIAPWKIATFALTTGKT